MPARPNPRSSREVAAEWGVDLDDLVARPSGDEKKGDKRLSEARKAYAAGVEAGSFIADPAPTGPDHDA
jgi:hypothetical protein